MRDIEGAAASMLWCIVFSVGNSGPHVSAPSSRRSSANIGEVSELRVTKGDSIEKVPGVERYVVVVDGGSMKISFGDTVWGLTDAGTDEGALTASNIDEP